MVAQPRHRQRNRQGKQSRANRYKQRIDKPLAIDGILEDLLQIEKRKLAVGVMQSALHDLPDRQEKEKDEKDEDQQRQYM